MGHAQDQAGAAATAMPRGGPIRFDNVEATLQEIFGPATTTAPVPVSPRALPVVIARSSARRGRRLVTGLVLAAAAATAGTVMGVTVFDRDEQRQTPPTLRRAPVAAAAVDRQPEPAPTVAVANLAVAPPATDVAPAKDMVAAPLPAVARTERPQVIVRELPVRATRSAAPVDTGTSRRRACYGRQGAASFSCLVEQLDAADRELVDAYTSAAEAGVPRAELVRFNRRWVRARDRARDDPADALQSYEQLADELWVARRQELRDDE